MISGHKCLTCRWFHAGRSRVTEHFAWAQRAITYEYYKPSTCRRNPVEVDVNAEYCCGEHSEFMKQRQ